MCLVDARLCDASMQEYLMRRYGTWLSLEIFEWYVEDIEEKEKRP